MFLVVVVFVILFWNMLRCFCCLKGYINPPFPLILMFLNLKKYEKRKTYGKFKRKTSKRKKKEALNSTHTYVLLNCLFEWILNLKKHRGCVSSVFILCLHCFSFCLPFFCFCFFPPIFFFFFSFFAFLFLPIYFCFLFFSVLKFCFWFSICFPFFLLFFQI